MMKVRENAESDAQIVSVEHSYILHIVRVNQI